MRRVWSLARVYGLDAFIVLAAITSALAVLVEDDPERAPRLTAWVAAPAIALAPLPLLARRRFPFAAPAAVWLLAATLSFADGRLVALSAGTFVAGIVAAFLLGRVPDGALARIGLAIVLVAAAVITLNDPAESGGDVVFTPLLFALAWLGGFALRERAQEAEAAQARAELAEREREVAARIAVAEERSRSARRVVEASDAERRRLERDLHDGAQSRLVALALKLQLARRQADGRPELEELLDESAAELALSLDELRELARGIHPAVLSDRGLAAALEALASRAPVPVEIRPVPPGDLPERWRRPSTSSSPKRSRTSRSTRARSTRASRSAGTATPSSR